MTDTLTPVLTAHWDEPDVSRSRVTSRTGGYRALAQALTTPPDDLIAAVKDAGLRGRGGAGFPTGMKWGFIPQGDGKPHYLVVNADESEPGTCKDIPLMMANPHALVEGVIITAYAIRAQHAFIYVRGEVAARGPAGPAGRGRRLRGRLPRAGHPRLRLRPGRRGALRRGRLHLRRGNRAAGLARGLPGTAPAQAAVPGRGRPVRQPRRSSTTSSRSPASRPSWPTAPAGSPTSAPRSPRVTASSRCPGTSPPRASTRRRSASRCASCWSWRAASGPATG